jgi:nucleotide-binding universal stress UspA family protein
MNLILISTDLSNKTDFLMKVGIYLSHKMKANMALLYSIEPMNTATATPPYALHDVARKHFNEDKKEALNKYQKIYNKFKDQLPGKKALELILEKGDQVSNIIATSKTLKPEIIILPQEHDGILEKILGETNNQIIQHVDVPVCIIPTNKDISPFQKVGYLIDYQEDHLEICKSVKKLAKLLRSPLYILHPVKINDFKSRILYEGFRKISAKALSGIKTDHISFDTGDSIININKVILKIGINLLVIVNENESMLQRWFTHTTAEKLMDRLNIPVLVYPK